MRFRFHRHPPIRSYLFAAIALFAGAVALPVEKGLAQMNSDQKSMMDKLSKLSGAEFDKEYMSDMVKDHEADAKEFENQANKGTDADIKAFAAKTLPMVQRHLQMARDALNQVSAK